MTILHYIYEPKSGDEVQLINAIYELRDTEISFCADLDFILADLVPLVPDKHQDLLFGGLDELVRFSAELGEKLKEISEKKNRAHQCKLLYRLFLDKLVMLREVYAPYCARQSQVIVMSPFKIYCNNEF